MFYTLGFARLIRRTIFLRPLGLVLLFIAMVTMLNCRSPLDKRIELAPLFKSNMVLQRGKPLPVWGKAQSGASIRVSFGGQVRTALANADGHFEVILDPLDAFSGGRELEVAYVESERVKPGLARIVLQNVVVGDVWFCAGQSNMEFGLAGVANRLEELKDVKYPLIRLCMIGKNSSGLPVENIPLVWTECDRENLTFGGWYGFSAVAFYFGRKLYKELGVPIGLVQAAYGGSSISPFIPAEEVKDHPLFSREYAEVKAANENYEKALRQDKNAKHPFDGITEPANLKLGSTYNIMVHPTVPFAMRGFLWYQGESNVGDGMAYAEALKALIHSWRKAFRQPDLPFYYVELPPWDYGGEGSLPALWEAQEAVLDMPYTGMAVIIDVADIKDIHPRRKKEVGERLALLALRRTYGKIDVLDSGPVFKALQVVGDRAIISFDNVGKGLTSLDGKPLSWFYLAGADLKFMQAQAWIEGDKVIVRSEKIAKPFAVRYAWSNVAQPNLGNRDGLPARPFRTDRP